MITHTQSYVHAAPPKVQAASTHWKHVSYLLTPPVGVVSVPSSRAPVKLQQSANLPANKKAPLRALTPSHPRCGSLLVASGLSTHQQGAGSSQHLSGRMLHQALVRGHDANGITSGSINLGLTATLLILQCISPQSQIFMLLLHFFSSGVLLCLESPLVIWFSMVSSGFMQTLSF